MVISPRAGETHGESKKILDTQRVVSIYLHVEIYRDP